MLAPVSKGPRSCLDVRLWGQAKQTSNHFRLSVASNRKRQIPERSGYFLASCAVEVQAYLQCKASELLYNAKVEFSFKTHKLG